MKILWQKGDHRTNLTSVLMALESRRVTVYAEDPINWMQVSGSLVEYSTENHLWCVESASAFARFDRATIRYITEDAQGTHIHITIRRR